MKLACCAWALTDSEENVLAQLAALGFEWVDIQPNTFVQAASQARMRALGLKVLCVGVSFGIPTTVSLDSADSRVVAEALAHGKAALDQAAGLGASTAYIIPGQAPGADARSRYATAVTQLADHAAGHGIRLCVEHFPGSALPTIADTLAFLQAVDHPNLYLLLDVGHAQMSNEDAAAAVQDAGTRLGYVHLDDNDGQNDLHLALLDGIMTETGLRQVFAALRDVGYAGGVSLEIHPQLPDPRDAIARSRQILQEASLI